MKSGTVHTLFLCTILALSSLIVCGSSVEDLEKDVEKRDDVPDTQNVRLNVLISGAHNLFPFKLFEERIKEKSGIELDYTAISDGDVYMQVKERVLGGLGSTDLAVIRPSWIPEFAHAEAIKPLDQFTGILDPELDDIITPYLELYCRYGDVLYSLPFDGDVRVYYFRRDLVEDPTERKDFKRKYGYELEVPTTWEEAFDFASFFTRKKGELLAGKPLEGDLFGIGMILGRGWCHYEWVDHFIAYNGFYFDEEFRPAINSEAGMLALEALKKLLQYAPPGALSSGYAENRDAFLYGKIASLILWSDMYKFIYHSDLSQVNGKVGVSSMPGIKRDGELRSRATMSHGRVMVIPSSSKIPEKAFWVASYMSTRASMDYTLDPRTSCDPFRYSHITKADTLSKYLTYFSGKEVPLDECEEYLTVIAESISRGISDLSIPFMREYIDILDLYLHRALRGELESKAALDRVAEQWEEISRSVGYESQKESWKIQYDSWKKLGMVE